MTPAKHLAKETSGLARLLVILLLAHPLACSDSSPAGPLDGAPGIDAPVVDRAMAASGADLCDWIYALLGSTTVLTAAEKTTMLDAVVAGPKSTYGLGVWILDPSVTLGAGPAQGHGGDILGFHTQAYWFPDKQTAICAVTNQDGTSPNDLTVAALKALFAQ